MTVGLLLFQVMKSVPLAILCFASFGLQAATDQSCPLSLDGVAVHSAAKMCQQFNANDDQPHQSMSYHIPLSTDDAIAYYQTQHNELTVHSVFNGRTLLTMQENRVRVAISADNTGAQVDILVL